MTKQKILSLDYYVNNLDCHSPPTYALLRGGSPLAESGRNVGGNVLNPITTGLRSK